MQLGGVVRREHARLKAYVSLAEQASRGGFGALVMLVSLRKVDDEEGSEEVSAEDSYTVGDFDGILDNEMLWDEEDEEEDEDLENFVYDGVFELEYAEELSNKGLSDDEDTKDMNRKQRREAAKNKPKRKLPHKGFGPQVKT